jgi:hypothetical protein
MMLCERERPREADAEAEARRARLRERDQRGGECRPVDLITVDLTKLTTEAEVVLSERTARICKETRVVRMVDVVQG